MWTAIAILLGVIATIIFVASIISRIFTFLILAGVLIAICIGFFTVNSPIDEIKSVFSNPSPNSSIQQYKLTKPVEGNVDQFEVKDGKVVFKSGKVHGEVTVKNMDTIQMTVYSDLSPLAVDTVKKLAVTFSKDANIVERLTGVFQNRKDSELKLENGWLKVKDKQLTLVLEKKFE
jgi:hypothetical protein